jgi:hypothetical protein
LVPILVVLVVVLDGIAAIAKETHILRGSGHFTAVHMSPRALSAAELLEVWERGLSLTPAQRALALLTAASSETASEAVTRLSISERDMRLLALRERIFGPRLIGTATCPACGQRLEFEIDGADIRAAAKERSGETFSVTCADYDVRFRLPDSLDLARLDPAAGGETNRRLLLQSCVQETLRQGVRTSAAELPEEVITAINIRMAEADPDAEVRLALNCPRCHHAWRAPLEIVSYFWAEIHAWAGRILREIHALACAYGWREADILALSPQRRQAYLEMIGS